MTPVSIKVVDNLLLIEWDNSETSKIKLVNLRLHCPCALCSVEKVERSKNYFPIYSGEQISIDNIYVIGNYAIGVSWKDGHNTGIYEFNYLRKLET